MTHEDKRTLIAKLKRRFSRFANQLATGQGEPVEEILPPAKTEDLDKLEKLLGIPLPSSYHQFLQCTRGLWLMGGIVQMTNGHPFFHDFAPFERLTVQQQRSITSRGEGWPPPSNGMLCFAEFFMEADGDQVLFDVHQGLINGEYPVFYYAHEATPVHVRLLAHSFEQWLNEFLDYKAFNS